MEAGVAASSGIVRRCSRIVLGAAFFASAFGVGIELVGFGDYLISFPFPQLVEGFTRPGWLEFLSFFFWIFWLPVAFLAGMFLLLAAVIEVALFRGRPGRWGALAVVHLGIAIGIFVLDRFDSPDRAVGRSVAVVEAIRRYEADRGVPPPNVESLVPEFLSELPNTWCPSYRGWSYEVMNREQAPMAAHTSDRDWDLSIDCRKRLFEGLRYDPDGPITFYSVAECRRIGDWIYWRD